MKEMNGKEILDAISGKQIAGSLDNIVKGVCQDSRLIKKGEAFFAIKGAAFDGHNFIDNAINGDASVIVYDNPLAIDKDKANGTLLILVPDSTKALQDLARYYLSKMNAKIIGVTGSTGKTSTRDMMYYVCRQKYKTAKNRGNYNTVVGVPLTILEMDIDTQVAVLEMGMDRFGEIDTMAELTRPDIGVITNIGVSHLEHLGSREGIMDAKMEITNYFDENNVLIISEGEDLLVRENVHGEYKVVVTGINKNCDLVIEDIRETGDNSISFTIKNGNDFKVIDLPVPGRHNALNASLAIAAGLELGITFDEAAQGLKGMELTGKRLAIKDVNGIKIIDDTYNASPDSMKAALETLFNTEGQRKVAVLGDMYELGENEEEYHKAIGEFAKTKADVVFTIGDLAKNINKELNYKTREEFILAQARFFQKGDVVLFKASRGMALEKVIEKLFY
ncbi:MAG: UDP-N-acetylmuramoyl-tripeptide--D-alanyl-D-alanine ligase [Anaerovoracaceae bacterium]